LKTYLPKERKRTWDLGGEEPAEKPVQKKKGPLWEYFEKKERRVTRSQETQSPKEKWGGKQTSKNGRTTFNTPATSQEKVQSQGRNEKNLVRRNPTSGPPQRKASPGRSAKKTIKIEEREVQLEERDEKSKCVPGAVLGKRGGLRQIWNRSKRNWTGEKRANPPQGVTR